MLCHKADCRQLERQRTHHAKPGRARGASRTADIHIRISMTGAWRGKHGLEGHLLYVNLLLADCAPELNGLFGDILLIFQGCVVRQ